MALFGVRMLKLVLEDNLVYLKTLESNSIDFIYIDPPFGTGKDQKGISRFDGSVLVYKDDHVDLLEFLAVRLMEAHRVLKPSGTIAIHMDWRKVHYVKVLMDSIFSEDCFLNEIIWAYDYGARQKSKWPTKHDNILIYVKDVNKYTFNFDEMDRIPYMAPGLVGKEKAEKGKTPTDVWWHTICPTNGSERTGYPTQKPIGIINRLVKIHSNPGDMCLDFFAGSGTLGESCKELGRNCILVDNNPDSYKIMKLRFGVG